jgi:exodeoxyribonuclease V alpha subunit
LTDAVRAGLGRLDQGRLGPDAALRDLTAHTLHQLLGYQPRRGTFRHHAENPLPAEAVIVDEVSMVGLVMMTRLLEAIAPHTRLILLGDKDQLPAVEAGALLAQLMPADGRPRYSEELSCQLAALLPGCDPFPFDPPHPLRDSLVVLEENYRSQQEIQTAAAAINSQEQDIMDRLPRFTPLGRGTDAHSFADLAQRGGCWWLDATESGVADWRRVLTHWAEHQFGISASQSTALPSEPYSELIACCRLSGSDKLSPEIATLLGQLFAILDRCRILTLLRDGPWGCVAVNRYLEQTLRPRLHSRGSGGLFAGAPVLITRNDHARQLYNGDVGVALRSGGGLRVVFARQDGYRSFPADALPTHELAFALTVHKSQGSEYDQVLLVLPPAGGRGLLTKELLYTGITRARHLAVVCGTREALGTAIGRKVEREAALLSAMVSASVKRR